MEDISVYKNRMVGMFYISVDKDIDKWVKGYSDVYRSIEYNGYQFLLDFKNRKLTIRDSRSGDIELCNYSIINNVKLWRYYRKLKSHFDNIQKNQELISQK